MPRSNCDGQDLSDRFDPAAWHRVYGDRNPTPARQLFQRITEEVCRAAQPRVNPGELWLDLGCGTGVLSKRLAGCGARLLGIDHDPAMLQWARERIIVGSSVKMLAAEVTRLPCSDHSVDGVVAASLTGCLNDIEPIMSELSRVLVPGGYSVLSFTNSESMLLRLSNRGRRREMRLDSDHPCRGRFRRYRVDDAVAAAGRHNLHLVMSRHFNCFVEVFSHAFPPVKLARNLEKLPLRSVHKRLCRNFVLLLRRGGGSTADYARLDE